MRDRELEAGATIRIHVVQGEQHVDSDPNAMLTTILGSCISACIWDAVRGIGGMNHFLLPGEENQTSDPGSGGSSARYGVHAMELLVNALLRRGARRESLQAKLFGGGRMIRGLTDIGEMNASFAERFVQAEGIPVVGGSLRGNQGRRIQFWPVSGRARQVLLRPDTLTVFQTEYQVSASKTPSQTGALELF
jgi:chemotaxis protein CheD